jgi:hypothetical protein
MTTMVTSSCCSAAPIQPGAPFASEKAQSKKGASSKKGAKAPRPRRTPSRQPRRDRGKKGTKEERSNKKAEVIAMMRRAKGATLVEVVESTGWRKHTVRGFVSLLGSKGGLKIESAKNVAGERSYRIAK